jgi:hypothetical protein
MQLVGAGISALSQIKAGNDAEDAAYADASLKAASIRKLAARTQGEAKANIAASGVDVNSPTARIINDTIKSDSEQDVMNTILSAKRAGKAAVQAGNINALGTGLNAFGSSYGQSVLGKVGQNFGNWKSAPAATSGVGAGP